MSPRSFEIRRVSAPSRKSIHLVSPRSSFEKKVVKGCGYRSSNIFMALSGRRTRTAPIRAARHYFRMYPSGVPPRALARAPHQDTRAQTRIRGDIFPNICSACTYIRRRLIESKGRGRYKVCRPPRHKTHALPGSTLPNERTSRSCSNVHLVSVDTPTLPSVPKKLEIGWGRGGGEWRGHEASPTNDVQSERVRVRVVKWSRPFLQTLSSCSSWKEGLFESRCSSL